MYFDVLIMIDDANRNVNALYIFVSKAITFDRGSFVGQSRGKVAAIRRTFI